MILLRGPNVILLKQITKINILIYTNILGGGGWKLMISYVLEWSGDVISKVQRNDNQYQCVWYFIY